MVYPAALNRVPAWSTMELGFDCFYRPRVCRPTNTVWSSMYVWEGTSLFEDNCKGYPFHLKYK